MDRGGGQALGLKLGVQRQPCWWRYVETNLRGWRKQLPSSVCRVAVIETSLVPRLRVGGHGLKKVWPGRANSALILRACAYPIVACHPSPATRRLPPVVHTATRKKYWGYGH